MRMDKTKTLGHPATSKQITIQYVCSDSPDDAMKSWLELGTTKGFAVGLAAGGFPGALAGAVEGAQGGAVGGAAAAIGCDLAGVYGGFILP